MKSNEATATAAPDQRAHDRQRERDTLLLHVAATCPYDATELSRRIARPAQAIHEDLTTLMSEGAVHFHDGALRTSAAARIVAAAPPDVLADLHDQLLAEMESGVPVRPVTLVALAESGCASEVLLRELVRRVGSHPDDAAALSALAAVARACGCGSDELRLLSATEAAARGRTWQVLSVTDGLLTSPNPETFARAGKIAAGALIQNNRLERALAVYQHIGVDRVGNDAAWAIVAAIGRGDIDAARTWRAALGSDTLTNHSSGLVDLVDGLLRSVDGDGERSLELLARSISTLAPLGPSLPLPETPAALAALVAIGQGDPAAAEVLLNRALKAGLGGESGRRRHLLLIAWSQMAQGRVDTAERTLHQLTDAEELCDRDRLLYWCLTVGIARRRTDLAAMRDAWHELRGHCFGLSFSLFDLLPLGEMMVVAARFREPDRIREMAASVQPIISGLGQPIVWTAPFHWSGVQAAFQANDPATLTPHANALVAARHTSAYAETLSRAGQTWLQVLRREADFRSVEASAKALAEHGQVWDASRLAGQAALQHPERDGALSLMQLARDITKTRSPSIGPTHTTTALTSRELEVAQLVVEGHGYRAIGEQLFISPKTVEHHVARIRHRLGASSRGELLEMLHDIVAEHD